MTAPIERTPRTPGRRHCCVRSGGVGWAWRIRSMDSGCVYVTSEHGIEVRGAHPSNMARCGSLGRANAKDGPVPVLSLVILSVVSASRSGAFTESKDPAALKVITGASGSSPYALRSLSLENSLSVRLGAYSIGVLRLRGCFAWRESAATLRMTDLLSVASVVGMQRWTTR